MAQLRKGDIRDLKSPPAPQGVQEHPLFSGKTTVGVISAQHPRFPAVSSGDDAMTQSLRSMGLQSEVRSGRYGMPERSHMVYGPTREQMFRLGKLFGQDAVIFSEHGRPELLHTNGIHTGRSRPMLGHEWFTSEPEDYYTHFPEMGGYLRMHFNEDQLDPTNLAQPQAIDALHMRAGLPPPEPEKGVTKAEIGAALLASLKKAISAIGGSKAHPNAYPWHNEHTDHHFKVTAPGAILASASAWPLSKAEGDPPAGTDHLKSPNDQAAGVGVSTYGKFALPYGTIDRSSPSDLYHYPYQGKAAAVNALLKDHGYNVYYAGGKYGRPDLAGRNYNTKHLMIYDPSPGSGGDFGTEEYTDNWRKVHELAHALTYPEVNKIYGEGRRIGKLGTHRTLREALRAVHWEHLASHKQRELSKILGVYIPDHVFNKEYNTTLHDAVHRAVTGKFTEPSQEGFRPHEYAVPLETSLGMVREAAHNLGITGMNDLMKKSENESMADEKIHEPQEWRQVLAKALRDRVDAYSKELLALRQAELKKSVAHGPAPEMTPLDACPLCGMPDMPGKCKCINGPMGAMKGAKLIEQAHADGRKPNLQMEQVEGGYHTKNLSKSDSDDHYNYYVVHKETGKIEGGNEYKEDAHDTAKDHPTPDKVKVMHRSKVSPGAKAEFHLRNGNPGKLHKDAMDGDPTDAEKNELAPKAAEDDVGMAKQECKCGAKPCKCFGKKEKTANEMCVKPKEPVKASNEGGNGIKVKKLKKEELAKGDFGRAENGKAATTPAQAAPKPKFQMGDLQAGKAKLAAAGVKPISPLGAPKIPGRPAAAPAPAAAPPAPAAGTTALKGPPAPAPAPGPKLPSVAPKIPPVGGAKPPGAAGAPAAAPKPAAIPKPTAPAPAAPKPAAQKIGKSSGITNDLKKSLGNCALCGKSEHAGTCG
jgi:hypothetical protein